MEINDQWLYQRCGQGIKLIKPKANNTDFTHTVANLLKLPVNIYFSNSDGFTEKCNELCALSCGYNSIEETIGHSVYDIPKIKKEYAELILQNNQKVMLSNRLGFVEESFCTTEETRFETLSIKIPWYNENNKIIGIVGWSIMIGQQPLASTIVKFIELGLLMPTLDFSKNNSISTGKYMGGVYFSKREYECLTFYVRGKSARAIGEILGISQRTVEQYLISIKSKMQVKTKSELIEKALQQRNF